METVTCLDMGVVDYAECWQLQKQLFDTLLDAKTRGVDMQQYLLLCEHQPVYTLGKSGHAENMLFTESQLRQSGASLYRIDRGGDITFHGPGQLVGYPILDLQREGLGLKEYIYALEESIIQTIAEYGITGCRIAGATGVWLSDDKPLRKIAAIGVRASRYVTMHGFALNVNTDLSWFSHINPCGFTNRGTTSIESETGTPADMNGVKSTFAAKFAKNINIKIKIEDYADRKTLGSEASGRAVEGG